VLALFTEEIFICITCHHIHVIPFSELSQFIIVRNVLYIQYTFSRFPKLYKAGKLIKGWYIVATPVLSIVSKQVFVPIKMCMLHCFINLNTMLFYNNRTKCIFRFCLFLRFHDFSIGYWNCLDSAVFSSFILFVHWMEFYI
jgi:hypothetical protein